MCTSLSIVEKANLVGTKIDNRIETFDLEHQVEFKYSKELCNLLNSNMKELCGKVKHEIESYFKSINNPLKMESDAWYFDFRQRRINSMVEFHKTNVSIDSSKYFNFFNKEERKLEKEWNQLIEEVFDMVKEVF